MIVPALSFLLGLTAFVMLLLSIRRFGHPWAGAVFCVVALLMVARRFTALAYRAGITSFDELDTGWLPFLVSLFFVLGIALARQETEDRVMRAPKRPTPPD